MKQYKSIIEDILIKAQKREPLTSFPFEKYDINENEIPSFIAFSLDKLPESLATELLISLKEKLAGFSENDWKAVVSGFSTHIYFANRTLIHFFLFHTDAPASFVKSIGLDTKSLTDDFVNYYEEAKERFYSEGNGMNRSLYNKLNLNSADLESLKKIGTIKIE
jgi:hypothetical protein